jgi:hypothetical protein
VGSLVCTGVPCVLSVRYTSALRRHLSANLAVCPTLPFASTAGCSIQGYAMLALVALAALFAGNFPVKKCLVASVRAAWASSPSCRGERRLTDRSISNLGLKPGLALKGLLDLVGTSCLYWRSHPGCQHPGCHVHRYAWVLQPHPGPARPTSTIQIEVEESGTGIEVPARPTA